MLWPHGSDGGYLPINDKIFHLDLAKEWHQLPWVIANLPYEKYGNFYMMLEAMVSEARFKADLEERNKHTTND